MHPSRRAKVRAALIAAVVLVHGCLAVPVPPRVSKARLAQPDAREEVQRWRALLGDVGVEVTDEELSARVVAWSAAIDGSRRALKRPLRPLLQITGTGQGWPLFAAPDTHPSRLEVHARIGGAWVPVFRRLDPDHSLMASELGFRRIRGIYDAGSLQGPYGDLAGWIAARVLDQVPEADAARVRLVRTHSTRPGAPHDPRERPRLVKIVERP